jgi:hypothetical protein
MDVKPNSVPNGTIFMLVRLLENDYDLVYTTSDGTQFDTTTLETYEVENKPYLHDPRDTRDTARQVLTFMNTTFAFSLLDITNATVTNTTGLAAANGTNATGLGYPVLLHPLSFTAALDIQWDPLAQVPLFVYWDPQLQAWRPTATTCGDEFFDVTSYSGDGTQVNITTTMCDPLQPPLPICQEATQVCTTQGKLAVPDTPCQFPFIYKNVSYDSCTTVDSVPGDAWCSTSGNYDQDGGWGFCNCTTRFEEQPFGNTTRMVPIEECAVSRNHSMARSFELCSFPFEYNGQNFSSCTTTNSASDAPWCATDASFAGNNWGYCRCQAVQTQTGPCRNATTGPGVLTGPGQQWQISLVLQNLTTSCERPVVEDIELTVEEGKSGVEIALNYTDVEGYQVVYELLNTPRLGIINEASSDVEGGDVVYDLKQYFTGVDVISYRAIESGLTGDGLANPCAALAVVSQPGEIRITVTNVNDAPEIRLLGRNSTAAFVDVQLLEDTPFNLTVVLLDHD